jgi:hypothetical protein
VQSAVKGERSVDIGFLGLGKAPHLTSPYKGEE